MRKVRSFLLHDFFFSEEARNARYNLSPSFAEPLSVEDLLAFEPQAEAELKSMRLTYPQPGGTDELREVLERLDGALRRAA